MDGRYVQGCPDTLTRTTPKSLGLQDGRTLPQVCDSSDTHAANRVGRKQAWSFFAARSSVSTSGCQLPFLHTAFYEHCPRECTLRRAFELHKFVRHTGTTVEDMWRRCIISYREAPLRTCSGGESQSANGVQSLPWVLRGPLVPEDANARWRASGCRAPAPGTVPAAWDPAPACT